MIENIKRIVADLKFEYAGCIDLFFKDVIKIRLFCYFNSNMMKMYIIGELNKEIFLEDSFEDLYSSISNKYIKDIVKNSRVIKNTSLLLLIEGDEKNTELHKCKVVFEDNPYYFKKYALIYSKNEVTILSKIRDEKLVDKINESIFNIGDINHLENDALGEILLKIVVKIPEIKLKSNPYRDLDSIEIIFKSKISEKEVQEAERLIKFYTELKS